MIKYIKYFLILILCLLLFSCWDYYDANEQSYILSVGVDKIGDEILFTGESPSVKSDLLFGNPLDQDDLMLVFKGKGKTYEEGQLDFIGSLTFPQNLSTTRVVILGPDFARSGIKSYINRANSIYNYRKTALVVVSREPAQQILEFKDNTDVAIGYKIEHTFYSLFKRAESIYTDIGSVYSFNTSNDYGYVLPYVGIENNTIKNLGFVIMVDSKMIDTIDTIDELKSFLYIINENLDVSETLPGPNNDDNILSFQVIRNKRVIKTEYLNEKVIINIDLDFEAGLIYQYEDEVIKDSYLKDFENDLSKKIKKSVENIIHRSQTDFKSDLWQFNKYFKAQHPNIYRNLIWKNEYPNSEINITVKTKIMDTNLTDFETKNVNE